MRTHFLAGLVLLALGGAGAAHAQERAQADSAKSDSSKAAAAKTDSAKVDSASIDTTRAPRPKPKPTPAPPAEPTVGVRTLAAGECPPAVERATGDALRRFAAPAARGPAVRSRRMLRDPTLRGRATLVFEVDTAGRADSATVSIVDGDPYLLPTARSSVALWRFRPAELLPGCPVRARTMETVTF